MIPNDYKVNFEERKTFEPLPKNIYQVELLTIDLVDALGKYNKPGDKNFVFQFTLLDGSDKGESLRGRNVWNNFVPTSIYLGKNGKNSLWEIVEAFLGRELTRQEITNGISGSLLNSFIGKQIKIFVDHRIKDGKTYDTISSYMPASVKINSLTEEEKDKATVKNKKDKQEVYEQPQDPTEEEYSNM